jgi:hypothetical protein
MRHDQNGRLLTDADALVCRNGSAIPAGAMMVYYAARANVAGRRRFLCLA